MEAVNLRSQMGGIFEGAEQKPLEQWNQGKLR